MILSTVNIQVFTVDNWYITLLYKNPVNNFLYKNIFKNYILLINNGRNSTSS